MTKGKVIRIVLSTLYISICLYNLKDYLEFNRSVSDSKPIPYLFIDKKINKGARGESYDMVYKHNDQEKTISITSDEYELIEKKVYPELYLSIKTGKVFSKWVLKKSLRITLLFFMLFLVTVFPWSLLSKR